jgi:hypothetical protein
MSGVVGLNSTRLHFALTNDPDQVTYENGLGLRTLFAGRPLVWLSNPSADKLGSQHPAYMHRPHIVVYTYTCDTPRQMIAS